MPPPSCTLTTAATTTHPPQPPQPPHPTAPPSHPSLLPLADTWSLDATKLAVLLPEEAHAAFGQPQGAAQLTVVHPSRGDVTAPQMSVLVDKALRMAEVDAGGGGGRAPAGRLRRQPALRPAVHR